MGIFLLFILTAFFCLAGFILFIIGLSTSKKNLTIGGAALTFISAIGIGYSVFSGVFKVVKYAGKAIEKSVQQYDKLENTTFLTDSFAEPVSATSIELNCTKNPIKIYPHKQLLERGIKIISIDTVKQFTMGKYKYQSSYSRKAFINLSITFQQNYVGKIMLIAYNKNGSKIGESTIVLDEKEGSSKNIEFVFHEDTYFYYDSYCTLEELPERL